MTRTCSPLAAIAVVFFAAFTPSASVAAEISGSANATGTFKIADASTKKFNFTGSAKVTPKSTYDGSNSNNNNPTSHHHHGNNVGKGLAAAAAAAALLAAESEAGEHHHHHNRCRRLEEKCDDGQRWACREYRDDCE